MLISVFAGCGINSGWLASSGPDRQQIVGRQQVASVIRLIDVDDALARRLTGMERLQLFSQSLAGTGSPAYAVGPGDLVEVSVWEASPATLFGATVIDPKSAALATSRNTALAEQMVAADGTINVPFAGLVSAAGQSPRQIESEIVRRLRGKANNPQVLVRVTRNVTANVTIVGEVAQSQRMPLTARGERLLDAIAAAGGVRQAVGKITLQVTRGPLVQAMPLEIVIRSPSENIALAPGDVITALFQPVSFTVLGATGKNEEINFEAQGISLAQALARSGGLQDARADAKGVFVFRFEDPRSLSDEQRNGPVTPDGRVPVVYRLDMQNPASFLAAQNFPVRNKDVLYVANAPSADLQKFLMTLTSTVLTVGTVVNLAR